jgi:hypothetical protein
MSGGLRPCCSEVWVLTHHPCVYIVHMLPTSFLPLNQTTICNHSASAFCDRPSNYKYFSAHWFFRHAGIDVTSTKSILVKDPSPLQC